MGHKMSFYKDSRNENVELDYNSLKISSPTDFPNSFSEFGGQVYRVSGSFSHIAGATVIAYVLGTKPGKSYVLHLTVSGVCTASGSGNTGKALFQTDWTGVTNFGGVLSDNIAFGNSFAYNGLNGASSWFINGQNYELHFINGSANDTYSQTWVLEIFENTSQ